MSAPSSRPARILLGHIADAQGIKGEVVVHAHTEVPEDVAAYGPLSDASGKRMFALTALRVTKRGVVCRIAGVTDRNQAEALRGTELYIERDRLPATHEEEFYHADLIGLTAVDAAGVRIGTVVAIQNFGADDLIEVRLDGKPGTELYPFTRACVPTIDIASGHIVIVPPSESSEAPEDAAIG